MERYVIPNLRNACRVLKALQEQPEGRSIPDLSAALGVPRTTTMRILKTFLLESFVRQDGNLYLLGPALIPLGLGARSGLHLRNLAIPHLRELTRKSGETSHLAVPSEGRSLIVEVCDSPHPLSAASRAGTLADLHCSSTGKVFLAWVYADQVASLYPDPRKITARTPNTATTLAAIREEVARTRKQGYGFDEEEFHLGVRCLAAPILDSSQKVIAAVGITASTARFTKNRVSTFAKLVTETARLISLDLGNRSAVGQ